MLYWAFKRSRFAIPKPQGILEFWEAEKCTRYYEAWGYIRIQIKTNFFQHDQYFECFIWRLKTRREKTHLQNKVVSPSDAIYRRKKVNSIRFDRYSAESKKKGGGRRNGMWNSRNKKKNTYTSNTNKERNTNPFVFVKGDVQIVDVVNVARIPLSLYGFRVLQWFILGKIWNKKRADKERKRERVGSEKEI